MKNARNRPSHVDANRREAYPGMGGHQDMHGLAAETFETAVEAEAWLRRPHPLLDGQTPLECAVTAAGQRRVIDILIAIKRKRGLKAPLRRSRDLSTIR